MLSPEKEVEEERRSLGVTGTPTEDNELAELNDLPDREKKSLSF